MAPYRPDLPEGRIGESWDLSDHSNGISVIDSGPLEGRTLREVTEEYGEALVGRGFSGGQFPLLIKLLDAETRLSVQVHPDDAQARALGLGDKGKTECWLMLCEGGELFVGMQPGVTRAHFRAALDSGRVESTLNRYTTRAGDFVFLEAPTVHALGAGCLLYEIQQTCDITFRVWDWGRLGLDGEPRPLHTEQALQTIDFEAVSTGPTQPDWRPHPQSGEWRRLGACADFEVDEFRGMAVIGGDTARCSVVVVTSGTGELRTRGGVVPLNPAQSVLVPAVAGEWQAFSHGEPLTLVVARPKFD